MTGERGGYVYIMADRYRGTIYTGVTADIAGRTVQHREGRGGVFISRYALTRLVYVEHHDDIEAAIAREKAVKKWNRAWKIRAIEEQNPEWNDLFDTLNM
ncbi:GIY-YIG nuclease family protein [Qipengyuania flava]|uniref:GIY-YIG nuclease family protein n=1 Tax=Qipengyuania flava TaxID=192812 RepID=UPI001CFD426D|nr:GIY-YIG nuclease family protein [Qipengyuania flava]